MKRNLKFNSNSLFRFKSFTYDIGAMLLRNGQHSLVGITLRMISAMKGKLSPVVPKMIHIILNRTKRVMRTQGLFGLVKYLKACSVIIQQYVCGYHVKDISPRVSRTNSGIPRILPLYVRKEIRRGNLLWIKLTLTLLSIFRDITIKTPPKFSTITAPSKEKPGVVSTLGGMVPAFVQAFAGGNRRKDLKGVSLFAINSSSPQVGKLVEKIQYMDQGKPKVFKLMHVLASSHPISLIRAAICFDSKHIESLTKLVTLTGPNNTILSLFEVSRTILETFKRGLHSTVLLRLFSFKNTYIGKLSLKQEAAGKMRVFAMVDPWTQWALYPIHRLIFDLLSKHSSIDGTFDQLKPIKDKLSELKGYPIYSMDLSAATDRLPLSLQKLLLKGLLNLSQDEIDAWAHLLVGREYWEPTTKMAYKYAVGQPMGAYSSWAMLALTHHFIVQVCAWTQNVVPTGSLFKDYVVLGDDIVIFNSDVAKQYHKTMTSLGVECNLSKSIMSPKGLGLEFAKKTFVSGVDVSPVPYKEVHSALCGVSSLINFGMKYSMSLPQILKFAGFGFKVIGSCNRHITTLNLKVKFIVLTLMTFDANRMAKLLTAMLTTKVNPAAFRESVEEFVDQYVNKVVKSTKVFSESKAGLPMATLWVPVVEHLRKFGNFSFIGPVHTDFTFFMDTLKSLFAWVYSPYRDQMLESYRNSDFALVKEQNKIRWNMAEKPVPFLLQILVDVMIIEKDLSEFSVDSLKAHAELKPFNKFSNPKMFDLGHQWLKVLYSLRDKGLLEDLPLHKTGKPLIEGNTFLMVDPNYVERVGPKSPLDYK